MTELPDILMVDLLACHDSGFPRIAEVLTSRKIP